MSQKKHVKSYGAATATTLRLAELYHGTGKKVISDSWFGSVKSATALLKRGLYSIMLVKTANRDFPRDLLGETDLEIGEWTTCST